MRYAIVAQAGGMVAQIVEAETIETLMLNCPAGHDPHPCGNMDVQPGAWVWDGTALKAAAKAAETLAEAEARLIAEVKRKANAAKLAVGTPLPSKSAEYPAKAAEVASWDSLTGGLTGLVVQTLNTVKAWSQARQVATFPYALADAAAHGDTIDKAIARFRGGITTSASVYDLAGKESKICTDIRAGNTIVKKEAAAAKWA